ncbi:MAG: hypothetical protein L3J96_03050 [Thermoplasmata archaeon]|nr:hypothetical protein [Thermoplasmata archaeon]
MGSRPCPTGIPGLSLFVTELASGNGSGNFDPGLLSGFTQATYLAAEVIQAAVLNISQVDVFALQSDYPGSWFDPTGLAHPVETLYTQVFPSLGNQLYATHLNVTANGEYAATFSNSTGPGVSLLVVNANTSVELALSLNQSGVPWSGAASADLWTPSTPLPLHLTFTSPSTSILTVPPEGILLVRDSGEATPLLVPTLRAASPGIEFRPYGPLTVTKVSVPLMPGTLRMRWTTTSSASLMCSAWILTMRSNGPVTASTSTTDGIPRTRRITSSRRLTSVSTSR